MASFGGASQDGVDDRVRVRFYSKNPKFQEPRFFEDYSVRVSVLQQPAAFAVRLSARDGSADLLRDIPDNTKFNLYIGLLPQFTGYTDAQNAGGTAGSTSVTFKGRDVLAKLYGNDVPADESFTNITYKRLVETAMERARLSGKVIVDNEKNKQIRTGVRVKAIKVPVVSNEVVRADGGAVVKHVVRAKLGESWLEFARRHLAKQGLFIWSDTDGNIVLSSPNPNQSPLFYWVRERNTINGRINVFDAQFVNDTTHRFSECVIYCRAGGRKSGRGKLHGGHVDQEMVDLGIERVKVYRDVNVTTTKEAEFYARRKIAEINRASWHLQYTFAGHSAPALYGGRAVIGPDLIAHIKDTEFGIDEPMYIESVEYKSQPQQTTTVTLMRIKDLIFGDDD